MLNPEALEIIYKIFLGLGIVTLVIGGIQIPLEARDDYPLMAKKLVFMIMVIFGMTVFRPVSIYIFDSCYELRDIARGDFLQDGAMKKVVDAEIKTQKQIWSESKSVWLDLLPALTSLIKSYFSLVAIALLKLLLFIPNVLRSLSCAILKMLLTISYVVSAFFIPMMTVKQTEGVGWRFVMGSLAIGLSPLAFPVIDYIIVEFVGTLAVLMLGAALPVSIAPGIALTEVVVTAIGALGTNPAGWGVLIFIICVLICMILFIFFAAAFGYFFTPFIFIRLLSSGDVASQMSGAFSNMTGHSSSILRSGIEGAEAGARSIKLANAKVGEQEAIAQVAQRADVPNDIASIAYKNSGGRIQDAISMASQMDKQRFTTPSGTYKAEPMPVGVKKTI